MLKSTNLFCFISVLIFAISCNGISPVGSYYRKDQQLPVPSDVEINYNKYRPPLTYNELDYIARMSNLALQYISVGDYATSEDILYQNIEFLIGVNGRDKYWKAVNHQLLSYTYDGMLKINEALKEAKVALEIYEQSLDERFRNSVDKIKDWIGKLESKKITNNNSQPTELSQTAKKGPQNGGTNLEELVIELKKELERLKSLLEKNQ